MRGGAPRFASAGRETDKAPTEGKPVPTELKYEAAALTQEALAEDEVTQSTERLGAQGGRREGQGRGEEGGEGPAEEMYGKSRGRRER